MTDIADTRMADVDLREKLAHIDQMLADIDRTRADHDRKRQEIRWYPIVVMMSGLTAGAALFAAGAAAVKLFG